MRTNGRMPSLDIIGFGGGYSRLGRKPHPARIVGAGRNPGFGSCSHHLYTQAQLYVYVSACFGARVGYYSTEGAHKTIQTCPVQSGTGKPIVQT